MRAANVIGRLLNGEPITAGPKVDFRVNGSNPFDQFRERQESDPEWTDYEDVTGEEDDDDDKS